VKPHRRLLAGLGAVLFVSCAYFYQAGGWNQNSRFALVRAIIERQTLQIDAYQLHTGDRAVWNGHYYSDKAPGQSLMALPAALVAHLLARAAGVDPEGFAGLAWISYAATVATAGLFTALAGVIIAILTLRWGYSRGAAIVAATAYGLASPALCYGTLFMAHGIAAGCLMAAYGLVGELDGADGRRRRDVAVALGLSAGWAVVVEFQAAIPAALIVAMGLVRARSTSPEDFAAFVARLAAAGAACAVVLFAYNLLAFGNPLHLGYQSEEGFEQMRQGMFGITGPQWWRVRELLVGRYRGLWPLAPLMAAGPIGLLLMTADRRRRSAALVALFVAVYYLVLNASYYYWEGGWAYGPRQMMSGLPFAALGLGVLWDRRSTALRAVLVGAWVWGAALTLVAESTNPQPPSSFRSPMTELLWPAFRDGDFSLNTQTMVHGAPPAGPRPGDAPRAAWNLGEVAGLRGHASLVPLLIVWAAGALLLRPRESR
jgi:hypothetical protein